MKCWVIFYLFFPASYLFQPASSPKGGNLSGAQFLLWTWTNTVPTGIYYHIPVFLFTFAPSSFPGFWNNLSKDCVSEFVLFNESSSVMKYCHLLVMLLSVAQFNILIFILIFLFVLICHMTYFIAKLLGFLNCIAWHYGSFLRLIFLYLKSCIFAVLRFLMVIMFIKFYLHVLMLRTWKSRMYIYQFLVAMRI